MFAARAGRGAMERLAFRTGSVHLVRNVRVSQNQCTSRVLPLSRTNPVHTLDFARVPPWERMRSLVAGHLAAHPLMQAVAPSAIEASRFGVRVRRGGEAVEVARFQWYLPLSDERARALASQLALGASERPGFAAA